MGRLENVAPAWAVVPYLLLSVIKKTRMNSGKELIISALQQFLSFIEDGIFFTIFIPCVVFSGFQRREYSLLTCL